MALTVYDIPPVPVNYDLNGKKIMVHDLLAVPALSTKLIDIQPLVGLIKMNVSADTNFIVPIDHKLNGIGIRNNTVSLMNITITDTEGTLIAVPLDPNGKADLDFGKNYFAQDTVNITGITGSVTLLIDIK